MPHRVTRDMTSEIKHMTVQHVFKDFANCTSMHGVPRIINAQSVLGRVFWSVICIGAFAIFSWQCGILLQRYFSYPKKVNMEIVQKPVPFPAVSICNADFLDMLTAQEIQRILDEDFAVGNSTDVTNTTEMLQRRKRSLESASATNNNSDFTNSYFKYWEKAGNAAFLLQNNDSVNDVFDLFSRLSLVANVGPRLATTAGVKLEDFVANCRFMDDECASEELFKKVFDPYYLNCFTFSPEEILENTRMQGVEYGLNLLLFSGSAGALKAGSTPASSAFPGMQENDPALASGRGARVVIHSPRTRPHPTASGYDIPPGFSVSIGVKARENVRINNPHGNCSEASSSSDRGEFDYTLMDCQNACIQRSIMKKCGCVDNRIMTDVPNTRNLPYCLKLPNQMSDCVDVTSNQSSQECREHFTRFRKTLMCRKQVYEDMTIRNPEVMTKCECYPPCNDIIYDTSYSLSNLPEFTQAHSSFYSIIRTFFDKFTPEKKRILVQDYGSTESPQLMQTTARLNVHISDSNIIRTTEAPDYEAIRLVSDIGGQLGLWIGISLITIFEVFQLAADILRYLTHKGRHISEIRANENCRFRNFRYNNGQQYIRPSQLDLATCEIDKLTTV